jgi:hypothetical protein
MCPIHQDTMVYSQRRKSLEYNLTQEDEGLSVGYIVHPGWKSNPHSKDLVQLGACVWACFALMNNFCWLI